MKLILPILGSLALFMTSCTTNPFAAKTEQDPLATANAANPYGVPNASAGAAYPTTQSQAYGTPQPVVQQQQYVAPPTTYTQPVAPTTTTSGGSHVIQKGDTLYGISRKYGTSVAALQSANGITGTTIVAGQTLQIP